MGIKKGEEGEAVGHFFVPGEEVVRNALDPRLPFFF